MTPKLTFNLKLGMGYSHSVFDPHTELRAQLLREMRQYRGKYGIYAAEMLETARLLLEGPEQYTRQAEAAACCIRQTVREIFGDSRDYKELLEDMVQRVAATKDRIQTTDAADVESLQNLYTLVDDLKDRVCGPKREARLKELFKKSSGIDPIDGPHSLIKEYRRIVKKSNELLHRVSETQTNVSDVYDHYEDVVHVLTTIFLPSERLVRIERLAKLSAPQKSDLEELKRTMKNAYDFGYFASKMSSSDWFGLMDADMLKSPSGNPPWLLRSLAWHLKDAHTDAFIRMLKKNFARWSSDYVGLGELGFVGYKLGDMGLPWLVKTLQVSKKFRTERDKKIKMRLEANQPDPELIKEIERMGDSIRHLDDYARRAFLKIKQPNSDFIELAEHLLSSDSTVEGYYKTNKIPAKLVECMDRTSAIHVVEILIRELKGSYFILHLGLVDGSSYDNLDGADSLTASLCEAFAKSRDLGVPTSKLINMLDALPLKDGTRFEAWVYSRADDINTSEIVSYIKHSCNTRPPSGEDSLLFDRLKRDGHIQDISGQVGSLLGEAPDTKKMSGHPRQWGISMEDRWHILWARTMHPYFGLPDEWKPCLDIVDGFYEAERDSGSGRAPEMSGKRDSSIIPYISSIDDPLDAAVDPNTGGFLELMSKRSPTSDLENAVMDNALKWVEDPAGIIRKLQRPEYVASYFRGLENTKEDLAPYAGRIITAVKIARTLRWDDSSPDSPVFCRVGEYTSVNATGIKLIQKVVESGVSLGKDSLADVWSILSDAIVLPDPDKCELPDYSIKYLFTVLDLPHFQAACTLVEVIRYAKLNNIKVPEITLAKLTEALRLTDQYGVDYHACIGPKAHVMYAAEPEWFEKNEKYLFGSATSTELGRVTIDACLMLYRPNAFILERYRDKVLNAVKRDVSGALRHLLHGLLWGTRGYEPEYIAKKFMKIKPEYISKTGWHMHKIFENASADPIQRVTAFWNTLLEQPQKSEVLNGFGWLADVQRIDQEQWEELMLRTCKVVKKLEWSQRVAERISTSQTITDTGWQILARLFSIDIEFEEDVAKHAMNALRKTVDIVDAPESRSHLREVLAEHGFHKVVEF